VPRTPLWSGPAGHGSTADAHGAGVGNRPRSARGTRVGQPGGRRPGTDGGSYAKGCSAAGGMSQTESKRVEATKSACLAWRRRA